MENASFWHFLKKADFERLNNPGKNTDEKFPASLALNKSVEELAFNLPRKQIFGAKSTLLCWDPVC